jgi:hypothetical protein
MIEGAYDFTNFVRGFVHFRRFFPAGAEFAAQSVSHY